MRRASILALTLALVGLACATERTVQWGEETPTEQTADATAATTTEAPVTAQAYAERFPTDDGCEAEARKLHERRPELAVRLIKACIERGDFKRLGALTDAPWTATLASDRDAAALVAQVVAARGGDLETDVKNCGKAGYPTASLDELFEAPEKAKGRKVVFRGRRDPDLKEKGRERLVETALESGELDTQPTGRRISAAFAAGLKPPVRDGVFLGKTVKIADDATAGDGEFVAVVDVTAIYAPASASTF
jgi:hypothetical protein